MRVRATPTLVPRTLAHIRGKTLNGLQIVYAMKEAGLTNPRVMHVKLRNETNAIDLFAGPDAARKQERVMGSAKREDVTAAINRMKG